MKRLTLALIALAGPVTAQDQSTGLGFTLGVGAQSAPAYFGSDELTIGPTGSFSFSRLDPSQTSVGRGDPDGFGFKGAFRFIGERSSDDYAELTGLADIDASLELGAGISFTDSTDGLGDTWGSFSFVEARYGVIGHESWVAEIGADLVYAPNPDWTFTFGPRVFAGSDDYAATYFGVTASEAAASSFAAFEATGGALSRGIEASASYDVNDVWGIVGTVTYEEFINDAATSPIVQQGSSDQVTTSIVLTRAFSF